MLWVSLNLGWSFFFFLPPQIEAIFITSTHGWWSRASTRNQPLKPGKGNFVFPPSYQYVLCFFFLSAPASGPNVQEISPSALHSKRMLELWFRAACCTIYRSAGRRRVHMTSERKAISTRWYFFCTGTSPSAVAGEPEPWLAQTGRAQLVSVVLYTSNWKSCLSSWFIKVLCFFYILGLGFFKLKSYKYNICF